MTAAAPDEREPRTVPAHATVRDTVTAAAPGTWEPRSERALVPVRDALVDRARERGALVVARAEKEAAAELGDARREADQILEEARVAGRADGEAAAAAERSRARARSRAAILAARAAAYEELRRRVRAATRELCAGPDGAALTARLADLARERLGPDAVIEKPPCGGIIARTPGAEIDLSADALTEQAVAVLGAEVGELWTRR